MSKRLKIILSFLGTFLSLYFAIIILINIHSHPFSFPEAILDLNFPAILVSISLSTLLAFYQYERNVLYKEIELSRNKEKLETKEKDEIQAILDSVPAYIYFKDIDGRYISVNRSFAIAAGIPKEKWVGKKTDELFPHLNLNISEQDKKILDEKVSLKGLVEQFEDHTGKLRWLETDKMPYIDNEGNLLGLIGLSLDITEKVQSEKRLKDRENRLKAVFNSSGVGLALLSIKGEIITCNDHLDHLTGYGKTELLNSNFNSLINQTDKVHFHEILLNFSKKRFINSRVDLRLKNKNNSIVWADCSFSIAPQGSQPDQIVVVVNDITGIVKARQEIKESESRLKLAFDISNEGLWDWNVKDDRIYFSPRYFKMLGYEPDDYSHDSSVWKELSHPDDYNKVLASLLGIISTNSDTTHHFEYRFKTSSGKWIWILSKARIVERDSEGQPYRIIGTNIDITALKESEHAFRQSELQKRQAIQNMPVMMAAVDEDDHILVWNRECERVSGYMSDEIVGNKFALKRLIPDSEYRLSILRELTDRRNNFRNLEVRIKSKRGEEKVIALSNISGLFPIPGWNSWIIGVDITERVMAEKIMLEERVQLARHVEVRTQELRKLNSELHKALKAKDEFLSTMSHELRTPLNAVLGLSEALLEQTFGTLNKEQESSLNIIEESGRHLLDLINDILDLSKIGVSKLELNIEPVDVNNVCSSAIKFIKQEAFNKNIKVHFKPHDEVSVILADQKRLKQIIVNLLSNAIKFTPENGEIGLEIFLNNESNTVNFMVWDTGIGIPSDKYDQLFMPFVQLDSSLTRKYQGTGLGLALVLKLAELHGGGINVQSEVNKGSRFVVMLPWRKSDEEILLTKISTGSKISNIEINGMYNDASIKPLILVVEDDSASVKPVELYLSKKGFNIIIAANGEEAVRKTGIYNPDLVLMDMLMPGMDGFEAIRQIKGKPEYRDLPIIAVTALAMEDDKEKCLAAGASDYISKPLSLSDLMDTINKHLNLSKSKWGTYGS